MSPDEPSVVRTMRPRISRRCGSWRVVASRTITACRVDGEPRPYIPPSMTIAANQSEAGSSFDDVLERLDADRSPAAGRAFADVIAAYLARAVGGEDPVSTSLTHAEITR